MKGNFMFSQNETLRTIEVRHSIRFFTKDDVSDKEVFVLQKDPIEMKVRYLD
jgi:hypothetical protein